MLYLQKYLTNLQKLFLAERWGRWLLQLKIYCAQIFWFCNRNVRNFPKSRKCKNFNFPLYTVPSRNAISSKVFNEFSTIFLLVLDDVEGGYCGWKSLVHRDFGFAVASLQLFQNPENVKISIFPYTLSRAEMPYLQKYLTHFQKHYLWLKDEEDGILWMKISFSQIFWFCNSNVKTFPKSRKCKNLNFFTLHFPEQKCYIFKSI